MNRIARGARAIGWAVLALSIVRGTAVAQTTPAGSVAPITGILISQIKVMPPTTGDGPRVLVVAPDPDGGYSVKAARIAGEIKTQVLAPVNPANPSSFSLTDAPFAVCRNGLQLSPAEYSFANGTLSSPQAQPGDTILASSLAISWTRGGSQ